jgi:aldehyde dehydrogenase (NAD+)
MVDVSQSKTGPETTSPSARGAGAPAVRADPAAEAQAAFEGVRATFLAGRTRPLAWRTAQLRGVEALVREGEAELLAAMAEDFGKPRVEAWLADLAPVAAEAAHVRRRLPRWVRPRPAWPGKANLPGWAFSVPEPLGAVLVLSPWNYPVQLALNPLVAAVAAGNAVVLKPSELTPATSAALARLVPRYLDPEAVRVVEGGVEVASALLAEPFDHVFFTGSTRVGRVVMEAASRHLASVTLELGGKSPVLVARDADLEVAARRVAWGKLLNAGQTCIAPDYALVERAVLPAFVEHLVTAMGQLQGPDPAAGATRIVNDQHLERLAGLLASAGGTVVVGGEVDRERRLVAPTVVLDPDPGSPLMEEEIFGPILPVLGVADLEEAVAFVRARPKPLALYLFTNDRRVEQRVLEATTSGGVCVNHTMVHFLAPELPFGGVGASGTGAYHGRAGFEELSHRRSVVRRPTRPDLPLTYPPFDDRKERWLRRLL